MNPMRKSDTMQKDLDALAANVRARRTKRELTLDVLSTDIVSSKQQVSNIEAARNWPSMPNYIAICRRLEAGKIPLVDLP